MDIWRKQLMRDEIKRIPRHIDRKGQHYAHLVAAIRRKYEGRDVTR
jgi:hypothetical protein